MSLRVGAISIHPALTHFRHTSVLSSGAEGNIQYTTAVPGLFSSIASHFLAALELVRFLVHPIRMLRCVLPNPGAAARLRRNRFGLCKTMISLWAVELRDSAVSNQECGGLDKKEVRQASHLFLSSGEDQTVYA